jgi:uncharacterized protein YjiS (DUF1127 family)
MFEPPTYQRHIHTGTTVKLKKFICNAITSLQRHSRQRHQTSLAALDDRLLQDIGLHRDQCALLARHFPTQPLKNFLSAAILSHNEIEHDQISFRLCNNLRQ